MQGMVEKYCRVCIWMCPKNCGTPKSSIFIGFSINHPFWDTPIFGNTHIEPQMTHILKDLTHKMEGQHPTLPPPKKKNYFTSSDPHHDMLGEGCQVNVIYHVKQAFQNVQTRHTCFLECCAILSHPARYSV